jgi:hypothetical protein
VLFLRLGATTTNSWRFSSAFDPRTIYPLSIPQLPLSILKKKKIPSASLSFSSFWVDTSFVSPMFLPRRCFFFVNPEKILFFGTAF